jgi:hypothetical protein
MRGLRGADLLAVDALPILCGEGQAMSIPLRNRARRVRLHARNFTGPIPGYDHAAFIRQQPCCACGRHGVDAAHVVARGMGGCGGDWTDLVPLCRPCHRHYDDEVGSPERYLEETGVDLRAYARRYAEAAR